jgi:hypothetical protein
MTALGIGDRQASDGQVESVLQLAALVTVGSTVYLLASLVAPHGEMQRIGRSLAEIRGR